MTELRTSETPEDDPLEELVAECLEAPGEGLAAALEAACRAHPEHADQLRARVGALRRIGLLREEAAPGDERFPDRLGEFELLERLGGGGMGVVFRALQSSLGREVALKLIRPEHLYFPRARERFQRETEAVARLQHPGIASIYTVGEENGLPYFAMELVAGCTLAEVIRALQGRAPENLTGDDLALAIHSASPRAAQAEGELARHATWVESCLALAIQVAEALQHAHERGVLHRDVKPSNIAVTPAGRTLLIDFGLASLGESGQVTASGSAIGSLLYMSPEQIRGDVAEIDRRSDVYSLGVTLYELLTLQVPYVDPRPLGLREAIVEGRPDAIRSRNRAVSRDLETVVLKAMDADRERRYPEAAAFAADLRNVLELRPVAARPPSAALRLRRWMQRNPAKGVAIALGGVLVVGVPSVLYVQQRGHTAALEQALAEARQARTEAEAQRAAAQEAERQTREQRDIARTEARDAATVAEFLTELFGAADPANAKGTLPTAFDLLERGEARLETELVDQPELRARLLERIGGSYSSLGRIDRAKRAHERALELRRLEFGEESEQVASSLYGLGNCLRQLGDKQALPTMQSALEMLEKTVPVPDERHVRYRVGVASTLTSARRHDEALLLYDRALAALGELPGDTRKLRELVLSNQASSLFFAHRYERAVEVAREAAAQQRELHGDLHPGLLASLNTLALSLKALGRLEEARPVYDEVLACAEKLYGLESDRYAIFESNKAGLLEQLGDRPAARAAYESALARFGRAGSLEIPQALTCRSNLAGVYLRSAEWALARAAYEDVLPSLAADDGGQRTSYAWLNLGLCCEALGDLAAARDALQRSLDEAGRISGAGRAYREARAHCDLARVLLRTGEVERARDELAGVQAYVDSDPERTIVAQLLRFDQALLALADGDAPAAKTALDELAALPESAPDGEWIAPAARARLAAAEFESDPPRARERAAAAAAELSARVGPDHPESRLARAVAGRAR